MTESKRKAHHPLIIAAEAGAGHRGKTELGVNNGSARVGVWMRYTNEFTGPTASLTPEQARTLARDLIERADEVDGKHWLLSTREFGDEPWPLPTRDTPTTERVKPFAADDGHLCLHEDGRMAHRCHCDFNTNHLANGYNADTDKLAPTEHRDTPTE